MKYSVANHGTCFDLLLFTLYFLTFHLLTNLQQIPSISNTQKRFEHRFYPIDSGTDSLVCFFHIFPDPKKAFEKNSSN